MNKYEEALETLLFESTYPSRDCYVNMKEATKLLEKSANHLQELVAEKTEQLSRKEKLVVGSEWECVVQCVVMYPKKKMTEAILTTVGGVCEVYKFDDDDFVTVIFDGSYFVIPPKQFLLCFKPHD